MTKRRVFMGAPVPLKALALSTLLIMLSANPMYVKAQPQSPGKNAGEVSNKMTTGVGDEIHQTSTTTLTTDQGTPVSDDQNSLRAGPRGPLLMEDFAMRQKIFHFDHERIPERVVHARGFGAHGYFENYQPLSNLTKADLFQRAGEKTPVFVRFSTVAGNKGSADLARDVRGFAVKFYTKQGNWDLVGNNMPVFFIQDGIKFPDLVHAAKDEPDTGFPQAATAHDNFWDFISLTPESMHMIMWAMSDRAIPRSFRFMEGFGVHTFKLVNSDGKSTFVKFHWKPKQGLQSVTWNEAVKINGADPDFHRRDLWNTIKKGDYPEWELGVQVFDDTIAKKFDFDFLDATKIIPEEIVPVQKVGKLVLNKTVDNFFAETEQVAFCTQNIVPGIDFSDDPLLQARNFSYLDTQLSRLGSPNFAQLPINAPKCPFMNFQQDGHMAKVNPKGRANYEPNSWGGPRENKERGFDSVPVQISGNKVRQRAESFADHYSQARLFYVSQTPIEQQHIADALVFELSKVEKPEIRSRIVGHLENIDADLASSVARHLGMKELPPKAPAKIATRMEQTASSALSIIKNGPATFKGRKLGLLVTDGADAGQVSALKAAAQEEGAEIAIVAPTIGGVTLSDGAHLNADHKINGGPSVLFDAIAIVVSPEGANKLASDAATKDFLSDAYAHLKFIGYNDAALPVLNKAGVVTDGDEGVKQLASSADTDNFIQSCRKLRLWNREAKTKLSSL